MKINIVKSEVYIQNSDGLYASFFHYMIKTCTRWELLSVIVAVRLILEGN